MRLIDEEKLMEDMQKTITEQSGTIDWMNLIYRQPTAYDVDKVVEQLEEAGKTKLIAHGGRCNGTTLALGYTKEISDAIEIVKHGGVSDDVCEWKVFDNSLTDEPQWVYGTTCGKYVEEEHTSKAFAYCPYCGKKIKAVE